MDDFIYFVTTDLPWLQSVNSKDLNPSDVGHFWVSILTHPDGNKWAAQVPNTPEAMGRLNDLVDAATLSAETTGPFSRDDMISQGFMWNDEKGLTYGTTT